MSDLIKRQDALDALMGTAEFIGEENVVAFVGYVKEANRKISELPSVEPEPISDAYAKAVLTWLIDYQIKALELKGRYAPYEVMSWVANDWRKEHERFNK